MSKHLQLISKLFVWSNLCSAFLCDIPLNSAIFKKNLNYSLSAKCLCEAVYVQDVSAIFGQFLHLQKEFKQYHCKLATVLG